MLDPVLENLKFPKIKYPKVIFEFSVQENQGFVQCKNYKSSKKILKDPVKF
jgi:hypothetical protein